MLPGAEQVTKGYGGRALPAGVTLYWEAGERFGVADASGAGKQLYGDVVVDEAGLLVSFVSRR